MSNSILTTPRNTTPHIKLHDEQLNPHNNNKNTTPWIKLNDEQLIHHNNNKKHSTTHKSKRWTTQSWKKQTKKHNTTHKAKQWATQSSQQQQQKTQHHTES